MACVMCAFGVMFFFQWQNTSSSCLPAPGTHAYTHSHTPHAYTHSHCTHSHFTHTHSHTRSHLQEHPELLSDVMKAMEMRLDHARVVDMFRKEKSLPLIKEYLLNVQKTNILEVRPGQLSFLLLV